jgi:hypothetical protein
MNRRAKIGFDRRINLQWLDAAAAQARAGRRADEIRHHLWDLLDGVVSGDQTNSARGKTVTVLSHIWGEVPSTAESLRQRAIRQFGQCTDEEKLALHWAMMIGTYPVFTDVVAATGRILALQNNFTLSHLTRRLIGTWGERSTLERAAQRIVRSMVQWEIVRDTTTRGTYEGASRRQRIGAATGVVLIEALLVDAGDASLSFDQLIGHPALFPFSIDLNSGQIRNAPQFSVHRQGLDADFVELRGTRN